MAIQPLGTMGAPTPHPASPQQVKSPRGVAESQAAASQEAQPTAMPAVQQQQQASREQVEKAVEEMKKTVESSSANNLQFSIDEETGKTVIKVVDKQTGETIRQIPAEEIIALAKSLDKLQGMLLRQKA